MRACDQRERNAQLAKRAQSALRESQAQLGLIVEHSSDVIVLIGLDGSRSYVSPAVERLLGWRPEDMVGSVDGRGPVARLSSGTRIRPACLCRAQLNATGRRGEFGQ